MPLLRTTGTCVAVAPLLEITCTAANLRASLHLVVVVTRTGPQGGRPDALVKTTVDWVRSQVS